jgi:flagellum-specific ATP synthase
MTVLGPEQVLVKLNHARDFLNEAPHSIREGRIKKVSGFVLEVEGLPLAIGAGACIFSGTSKRVIDAECIGFDGSMTFLMAIDAIDGITPGALVYPANTPFRTVLGFMTRSSVEPLPIDFSLLGRVVDGFGRPLDGKPGSDVKIVKKQSKVMNPLLRSSIHEPLDTGIRSVNAMLTVGRGQRLGIFAGSGVGKSVLLGMLARNCKADVIVISLVGERGREVREFCEDVLGEEALQRAVVVAAPADSSPLARAKGAWYGTEIAAWFRDQGKHVVLIVDSLTRFAMAQREIGLSLGEAPVSRGYTPSVFGKLPELIEKAGNGINPNGSLTAFYTILLEGDDINDPISDTARGVLDGHLFLSRELADGGYYPAIDIERSISRVMPRVVSEEHLMAARRVKQLYSRYMRGRDLLNMGAYAPGSDPDFDKAIRLWPEIQSFLQQDVTEVINFESSLEVLLAIAEASR